MIMKNISSQLVSNANQHCQSLSGIKRFLKKINSRNKSKSSTNKKLNDRKEKIAMHAWMYAPYWILMMYCFLSDLWLPHTMSSGRLPLKMQEEISERIYAEKCASYSSGHAFHTNINILLEAAVLLLILVNTSLLAALISPDSSLELPSDFGYSFTMLVLLAIDCICMQVASSLTCRPAQIFYDRRFISILTTQLTGFIGCLLVAYKLGSIFAIKIPKKIVQDKFSFIPFSHSCIINLK